MATGWCCFSMSENHLSKPLLFLVGRVVNTRSVPRLLLLSLLDELSLEPICFVGAYILVLMRTTSNAEVAPELPRLSHSRW